MHCTLKMLIELIYYKDIFVIRCECIVTCNNVTANINSIPHEYLHTGYLHGTDMKIKVLLCDARNLFVMQES